MLSRLDQLRDASKIAAPLFVYHGQNDARVPRGHRPAAVHRLRASGVPLTVAVGADSRDTWFEAASAWLAAGTGAELVELPGGHAGLVTHPAALAELVRGIARRPA